MICNVYKSVRNIPSALVVYRWIVFLLSHLLYSDIISKDVFLNLLFGKVIIHTRKGR